MCKYVKGDKGRRVTREMLLLWKLDEVIVCLCNIEESMKMDPAG